MEFRANFVNGPGCEVERVTQSQLDLGNHLASVKKNRVRLIMKLPIRRHFP